MNEICDAKIMGYNNGLYAAAMFIQSGRSFEDWYGDGPYDIANGWKELLISLDREKEFYDLKKKLDDEKLDAR
jgi:hypothetical protein